MTSVVIIAGVATWEDAIEMTSVVIAGVATWDKTL